MKLVDVILELVDFYCENGDVECCVFNEYFDNASDHILFKFIEDGSFINQNEEMVNGDFLLLG